MKNYANVSHQILLQSKKASERSFRMKTQISVCFS